MQKRLVDSKALGLFWLFVGLCLRYAIYGFEYYPVLDDFIQYGSYPLYQDLKHVYFGIGTMSARPFASLLDPTLWGSMWGNLRLALILVTMIHFFTGVLFVKVLQRNKVQVSQLFLLIFLALPLSFEGYFWLSASSRLVIGLFFVALSLYALISYIDSLKWYWLSIFVVSFLLSCGFYESVLVVGFVSAMLVCIINSKRIKHKIVWIIPTICIVLMAVYYKFASNIGALGSRASGFTFEHFFDKITLLFQQLTEIMIMGTFQTTILGFGSGLQVLSDGGLLGILLMVAFVLLSILSGYYSYKLQPKGSNRWTFLCGALLFLAPLAPHVLIEDVWLTYRNTLPMLIGLGLMLEPIFQRCVKSKKVHAVCIAIIAFIFFVANVNEYDSYKRVSMQDISLCTKVVQHLDDKVLNGERGVILIMEQEPYQEQVSYYKDHVKSVFDADWSLTGAVRAVGKNLKIKKVTPVLLDSNFKVTNEQILYLDKEYEIQDRSAYLGED